MICSYQLGISDFISIGESILAFQHLIILLEPLYGTNDSLIVVPIYILYSFQLKTLLQKSLFNIY